MTIGLRVMVVVMLLSCLASVSLGETEARRAIRWERERVPVWDYTDDAWRPAVQHMVAEYNRIIPTGGPVLVYTPMGETPCETLPWGGRKHGITVCQPTVDAVDPRTTGLRAYAETIMAGQTYERVKIVLSSYLDGTTRDYLICHEFGHAILGAHDNYAYPHRETSCVQGMRESPGAWERKRARALYGKHLDAHPLRRAHPNRRR